MGRNSHKDRAARAQLTEQEADRKDPTFSSSSSSLPLQLPEGRGVEWLQPQWRLPSSGPNNAVLSLKRRVWS